MFIPDIKVQNIFNLQTVLQWHSGFGQSISSEDTTQK